MDSRSGLRVLNGAVLIYTALIIIWLLLRLLFFDRFWPLALVNTFAEYCFVPLPFLIVAVLMRRHGRLFIPLLIPALAFFILFGELFLPSLSPAPRVSGPALKVMTFNVLWSNHDSSAIAAAVRAAAPDFVGLQELHPTNFDGLARELETDYPYHTPAPAVPSGGVGLFSRFPIESAEPFPLPPRNLSLYALVNVNGTRLHVFVVHLSANNFGLFPLDQFAALAEERYASRAAEAAQLETLIAPIAGPVILLCDCNFTDTSQAYARVSSFLHDSFREAGWGFGHSLIYLPFPVRTQRLDYVWHNASFISIETKVGIEGGSDHLPVTATLALLTQP